MASLVLCATGGVALAQQATNRLSAGIDPEDAVSATQDVEGHGVKVGEGTVLHPVLGIETGYISNVFYENQNPVGAGLIRVLAEVDTSSLPPARLSDNDANATTPDVHELANLGVFEYDASVHASYDQYLSNNGDVTSQGGLGLGVLADAVVNPNKPVVFDGWESFNRLIRATNFESAANTNRDINLLKLHLAYRPFGRNLAGLIHYTSLIDVFEANSQHFADRFQNSIGARVYWQVLPQTRLTADVSEGIYTGIGDSSTKVTSYPLTAIGMIQTALTVNSTLIGRVGYTNGFYASGPSYSSVVGGLQLGYRFNDFSRVVALYSYDHEDSINAIPIQSSLKSYRRIGVLISKVFSRSTRRKRVCRRMVSCFSRCKNVLTTVPAQNEIIASLTALNEKLQAKAATLEKALTATREIPTSLPAAGGVFEAPAGVADPKQIMALKDELAKAQIALKGKDEKSQFFSRAHRRR